MHGHSLCRNWEIPRLASSRWSRGPHRESQGSTAVKDGRGKSDSPIVPKKPPNNGGGAPSSAEGAEGRGLAKGNPSQQSKSRTQCRTGVDRARPTRARSGKPRRQPRDCAYVRSDDLSHALERIRQAAAQDSIPGTACASDPRQEPGAVVPHAGICAGGRPRGRSLPRLLVLVLDSASGHLWRPCEAPLQPCSYAFSGSQAPVWEPGISEAPASGWPRGGSLGDRAFPSRSLVRV